MSDFELRTDDAAAFFDKAAADPARVLVAMDFDGTLAPIVPDPTDSRLLPAAADAGMLKYSSPPSTKNTL